MREETLKKVRERKIIAIARGLKTELLLRLADALYAGGIDLMEITFQQAHPETWAVTAQAIQAVSRHMQGKMLMGAGTVINQEQLDLAYTAGAQYIVTPNTNLSLIRKVREYGLVSLPGAFTPTEIEAAYQAGADAIKVFPASSLGANYIKAIKAPLSHIPLLAVGGINEKNAADFMAAGCCGIGVGGNLVNQVWLEAGETEKITALAEEFRRVIGCNE
ncbi:MAG: bifunctional 4-hydroxy-2-oxoglutarate aldolase/2-dehydro-3-deoxy-phosphogluconate aldolase [Firmicutes bacterium]|nr:bifunctional 4-hydroxy-2-oxoglutarate aldolase/2-dehydro-3-deoxy-phosphogluconate aldolase [Bacillota bacterium]